ncbi:hypothetical protein Esti_005435 [Eimeria stiedai]
MATVSATAPVGNLNNDKAAQKPSSMQSSGAPPVPSSAQGVLALLQEDNTELQAAALMQLKDLVEVHWMELADVLPDIEALVEDQAFPQRDLAAHVASRIYFHLEAFSDALKFALESGPWLDLNSDSLYAETILAECIDEYIRHRTAEYEAETLSSIPGGPAAALATSSEDTLIAFVHACVLALFASGTSDEAFRAAVERVVLAQLRGASGSPGAPNALGIALDARRIEEVELLLTNAPDKIALLNYLSMNLQSLVSSKRFRQEVTALVTRLYKEALHGIGPEQQPEVYGHLCRCLLLQEDIEGVATILNEFMRKPKTPALPRPQLVAYQIAFDLMDLENPNLMQALLRHPLLSLPKPPEAAAVETAETPTPSTGVVGKVAEPAQEAAAEIGTQQQQQQQRDATTAAAAATAAVPAVPVDNLMTVTALAAAAAEPEPTGADSTDPYTRKLAVLRSIVSGSASVDFTLQFLNRKSNTDLQLLDSYKNSLDARLSLLHHGLLLAHALQQSGTGCDVFLRRNLEWMGRAANWSKYSATASIGAIHRGNVMNSVKVLQTYLPGAGGGGASASHSEGGALYALGLIHSCLPNPKIRSFILGQLRHGDNTEKEAVLHGGCLGLGLTCLGDAADSEAYDALRTLLFLDSAITGEGAALGLGLLLMGSGSPSAAAELLGYARDTQHEKIGRACAVALALICFQREEEASNADSLIRQCLEDSDALIRYGGVFCIGMAYCATGKASSQAQCKTAVERLLHRAVADVNDDVRRAAVLSLGFVLCGHSEELLRVMKLLGGSFNPHVRYGAAFALGFASAGSGNAEAVQLLQALTTDPTDFVRQGAFIGLGLLMQLQNEASCPGVTAFRETLQKVMKDKHEDSLARFGAVLAAGLLDAGGRNVSVRFFSARKVLRMHAVAGVCLFAQLWYSFPLIYCLCLSFSPSALIGLVAHDELEEAAVLEEVPAAEEKTQKKDINESAVEVDGGVPTAMAAPEETSQQQQEPQQQDRQSAEKPEKKLPNIATLRIPCGWKIACKAPDQSLFAYPPPLSAGESKTDAVKAVKAILSTTAKRNAAIRKQQEKQEAKKTRVQGTQMDTDAFSEPFTPQSEALSLCRERSAGDSPAESVKEGGDNTVELINPCRVLARQEAFLKAVPSSRYRRVLGESLTGFIILDDKEPTQAETYIEAREKAVQEKEPEPFEPFHWTG